MELTITKRTDPRLLAAMAVHYSQPKGFVGRNICYAIAYQGIYYGHIVAGSATLHLPGRHQALGTTKADINGIVNNIFFHIEKQGRRYPMRNFVPRAIGAWRERESLRIGQRNTGMRCWGFESLVELPRIGECYLRDGWIEVGVTKGETCKRVAGKGTDSWGGRRVWSTDNLRPKRVFVYPLNSVRAAVA